MAYNIVFLILTPLVIGVINLLLPAVLRKILNVALLLFLVYPLYLLTNQVAPDVGCPVMYFFKVDKLSFLML